LVTPKSQVRKRGWDGGGKNIFFWEWSANRLVSYHKKARERGFELVPWRNRRGYR